MISPLPILTLTAMLVCSIAVGQETHQPLPQAEIRINPGITYGEWEGWGTSLAWMGKAFGDRDDIADILFTTQSVHLDGQQLPGLGLNIVRYNAGGSSENILGDGRKMAVSNKINHTRQVDGFWLDPSSSDPNSNCWNWSADANQRTMLQKARDRGANHFELFSNSPMWWMCKNNNPSGAEKGKEDNLGAENYQAFATYLAVIAARAKSHWGITFTSVEPFNEPVTDYWHANGTQEGCHFDAASQVAFLPILRAELNRRGLREMPIAASDENAYDNALRAWQVFPPNARALVSRFNVHGYSLEKGNRAGIYQAVTVKAGKPIWNSEHGDKFGDGLEMARNIHRDMAELHPTAWCYWQPLDGGGWGLIGANLPEGIIGKVRPKYFVMAQYTRHVRPGMFILDTQEKNTVAAYDSRARTLVLVTLNDGPSRKVAFNLSAFRVPDGQVSGFVTKPLEKIYYQPISAAAVRRSQLAVEVPANSISTFEIRSISPAR